MAGAGRADRRQRRPLSTPAHPRAGVAVRVEDSPDRAAPAPAAPTTGGRPGPDKSKSGEAPLLPCPPWLLWFLACFSPISPPASLQIPSLINAFLARSKRPAPKNLPYINRPPAPPTPPPPTRRLPRRIPIHAPRASGGNSVEAPIPCPSELFDLTILRVGPAIWYRFGFQMPSKSPRCQSSFDFCSPTIRAGCSESPNKPAHFQLTLGF